MRLIEFSCFLDTCLTDLDHIVQGEMEFRWPARTVTWRRSLYKF